MTPHLWDPSWTKHHRRHFLALLVAGGCGLGVAGCSGPLVRMQSPDPESLLDAEVEKRIRLIGDLTGTWGVNYLMVESVALVTELDNTGSDPPPSTQRQLLLAEMQSHDVREPNTLLASPKTALVMVRGFIPPGCLKGEVFDIEVRVAPRSETSSLRGGWLMQTRLREKQQLQGGPMLTGHIIALAQGPVIVDAVFEGKGDTVLETRGRVLSGATATKDRMMGLVVTDDTLSNRATLLIGSAINNRFHSYGAGGSKEGMASPKDDDYVELKVYPRYKNNIARYIRVIRSLALQETTTDRGNRLNLLDRMIMEPSTAARAALQLEAIGKEGIPILKRALSSPNIECQFYAAEALAYLDQDECAPVLKDVAEVEPAYRWHALTALASFNSIPSSQALTELLHVPSAETRYGAFRALKTQSPHDSLVRGEAFHQEFTLHVLPSSAEPMVHFTQSSRPEVVLFGDRMQLLPTDFVYAGKRIVVKRAGENELRISRFAPGEEDKIEACSTQLADVIRTVARLGGRYQDILELVHDAKRQQFLSARVVIDALPSSSRLLEQQLEESAEYEITRRRAANPLPEMFTNRLGSQKDEAEKSAAMTAALELERQAAHEEEASKKPGFFGRMMPWNWSE